jgi:hypothetical protein
MKDSRSLWDLVFIGLDRLYAGIFLCNRIDFAQFSKSGCQN